MQRNSQRESVLLGYSPEKTLMDSSSAPKSPDSNSGIDFNDVFGGPPRSSSIQRTRYSFGENPDSYSLSSAFRRSDETFAASMNPWSGLSEKPVFGEEGMSRGRYPKNDFFDDIFRGNESLSSSPRKYAMKDPFAPGSLLSSPARLPPMAEPFGSSLPSRFSLPAKLNKGMDLPPFGSLTCTSSKSKDGSSNGLSYYACSPMSRFSGQANQDKEGVKNDFQSSFRFSALSQELSTGSEELISLGMFDETETKGNSVEDFNGAEISKNGSRFHFSIYKWDNKGGGPLAAPLRGSDKLKEKDKLQRCSSANGWIACESMAMESKAELHNNSFSATDRMSANAKSFRVERDKNETLGSFIDSGNEDGESGRTIKEDNIPNSVSEIGSRFKTTDKNVSADKREKQVSAVGKETKKPQPKTLKLLFHDDDDCEQGNDKMTRNVGTKGVSEKSAKKLYEIVDGENIKKQEVKKRATANNTEAGTTRVKGSPRNSWDNGKGGVKGKVKEFIKIFNQDASPKPRADSVCEGHSSRRMERHTIEPENEPSMTEREEKIHMPKLQKKKSSPDVRVANHLYNNASEKNITSSATDSVSDGSKTIIEDPADSFEDNFSVSDLSISKGMIEDLTPEEKILPEFGIDPEEIKAIDAKIQQWSNGKQGNIRSLLSTLQYVLWPNSGWKPVPLVDIIEVPAVKRSYQKALLCLHPDKLQQKGAASDKKYNAEKVFDVLQDAWTHFNSLGSM